MPKAAEVQGTVQKKKKKKLKILERADGRETGVQEVGPADPEPGVSGKKKRKASTLVQEEEDNEVDTGEILPVKKKKKAKLPAEPVEEDTQPTPKKKKKKEKSTSEIQQDNADCNNDTPDPAQEASSENNQEATSFRVFIGGLPWSVDDDTLRRDFSECGEVTEVQVLKDKMTGKSRGIGFVTFKKEDGLKAALKYDGDNYGGRTLKVTKADDKGKGKCKAMTGSDDTEGKEREFEVFVKGLAPEVTEQMLWKDFSECGKITRLNMPRKSDETCKGFAWVTFKNADGLKSAITFNGDEYAGRTIVVEKSGEHKKGGDAKGTAGKAGKEGKGSKGPSEFEIFVKGLPFKTKESDLQTDFSECGEIEKLKMPTNEDGKCKGFAWITFTTKEAVEEALKYDGDEYGGCTIGVEKAGQHKLGGQGKGGKGKGKEPTEKPAGCTSIVVKGLSYEVNEQDLEQFFVECGQGTSAVKLLKDKDTKKSKGIAFVDFHNEEDVDAAMKHTGSQLKGRTFHIDYATPK